MIKKDGIELLKALSKDMDPEELYISAVQAMLSAQISVRRVKAGLSQTEFAHLMGVKQSQISRWENGDSNPTIQTLSRMEYRLNMHIKDFLAIELPSAYYDPGKSNVIPMRRDQWHGVTSRNIGYSDEVERQEM